MLTTHTIQTFQVTSDPDLQAAMQNVAGQLTPTSRRTYAYDARHFALWMTDHDLTLHSLSRDQMVVYRAHLGETYAKTTASHIWAVAWRLLDEAVQRQVLTKNPAEGIRGFRAGDDESPHQTLKQEEARSLLDTTDRNSALGKRDYALLSLLSRTGIHRSEVAGLVLGDLIMEQGYHVVIIRHGKGSKLGFAKLPVEVRQAIDDYLETVRRTQIESGTPLFVSFRKGDHPQEKPITRNQIERVVKTRARALGMMISPHGLCASFITMAFEDGTDLVLVQDAVKHKDPRNTKRYQERRNSLHRKAVDFVWI